MASLPAALLRCTSGQLLRTWLCFHLRRPCVSAILHSERICRRPALSWLHRGHLSSLPNQQERFWRQGKASYAALIRKLSSTCGTRQMSALAYDSACGVLPIGPCPLFGLRHSLDKVALLFQPCDHLCDHDLLLLPCGFRPELNRFSPAQSCLAVLHPSHNLFMLQPAGLLGPPLAGPSTCAP